MDPLTVFKDFVQNGQLDQVHVDEGKVRFADKYSFPASAATAFRREGLTSAHYPLAVVVNFFKWHASGTNLVQYIRQYPNKNDQVALPDRASLTSYLKGEVASVPQLDENVPLVPFEPPAKRQKVGGAADGDAGEAEDALQHLFGHEKQLRDRNSLLCAPGADLSHVLDMVDKVMAARKGMEAAAARAAKAAAAAAGAGKPAGGQQRPAGQPQQQQKQPAFVKASGRLERAVDAKGTLKALGAAGGVAEQLGLGYGLAAGAAAAEPGRAGRPSSAAAAAGGAGQKQGGGGSSSGSKDPRGAAAAAAAAAAAGNGVSGGKGGGAGGGGSRLRPLILVPAGYSALVNLYNAKQLLGDCRFVPSAVVQSELEQQGKGKPQAPLDFVRTARRDGSRKPRYQITDKVPKPGHPDWKRVVAVIVQGKPWQFKDFPFKGAAKGDMVDTFSNVFGAFFHYKDEAVPDAVNGWKVAKLPLRRDVRHLDDQVVLEFYDKLDAFLLSKRRADLDY